MGRRCILSALFALIVLIAFTSAQNVTTPPLSPCEICRDKGDCKLADRGQAPGQFCHNWLNAASQRQACCCPQASVCMPAENNYECKCDVKRSHTTSSSQDRHHFPFLWIALGVILIGFMCGAGIYMFMKRRNVYTDECHPQPVYVQGGPAQTAYAPGYAPGYASGYGPGYGGGNGGGYGGGAGAAAAAGLAVGAGVGLVGGLAVGEMLADAGDHGAHCGDFGGGGFAGDF